MRAGALPIVGEVRHGDTQNPHRAQRITEGKHLYELTAPPVPDIAAMMGISRRTLERRLVEWGWTPRGAPRHTTDRALVAAAISNAAPDDAGDSLPTEARMALNAVRIQRIATASAHRQTPSLYSR